MEKDKTKVKKNASRKRELLRCIRPPSISAAPSTEVVEPPFADPLEKVFVTLRSQTGHDFSLYKRNAICRRIERRMAVHQFKKIGDYLCYFQQNKAEVDALFKELLIGVTHFFRDPEVFEALQEKVVPPLYYEERGADRPIRIWSAGCATGEEAYSIAMILMEEMERLGHFYNVQIFATDINEEALEFARTGLYPEAISADVSPQRLRRFFEKEGNRYRIKKQIREMVTFAKQDLIKDPPFSKLDLIVCRNLLIYLSGTLQKKILPLFHYTLNHGGYLVLGPSETIGEFGNLFSLIDSKWKLFRRKSSLRPAVEFPSPVVKEATEPKKESRTVAERDIIDVAEKWLLDEYIPPSVIINEKYEIIHFRGRTGPYLEHPTGEARINVLKLVRGGLRVELRSAVREAFTRRERVVRPEIRVEGNGIRLTVQPFQQKATEGLAMVVFEEGSPNAPSSLAAPVQRESRGVSSVDQRIFDLERELNITKESLQTTIEELETSNEELKSTNEALQSTHEELVTVNAELQSKIDELAQSNNDMINLPNPPLEQPLLILNKRLQLLSANDAFYKVFRIRKEESDGQDLFSLGGGGWNVLELKTTLEEMIAADLSARSIEVVHHFPQLGRKRLGIALHRINLREKAVMGEEELILLLFKALSGP
jgi:two-component system CheB/CheR fusion protein